MATAQADLDLAAAHADKPKLKRFEGRDVLGTTVKVTNAGDGLSQAMKVEPREFKHDETVYLVLECKVAKVAYVPLAEGVKELVRVHTFAAGAATVVDADLVREHIERQHERIQAAIDHAKGVTNLDGTGGPLADSGSAGDEGAYPDEEPAQVVLRRHHMAGRHEDSEGGHVLGCPLCAATPGDGEPAEPTTADADADGAEGGDA